MSTGRDTMKANLKRVPGDLWQPLSQQVTKQAPCWVGRRSQCRCSRLRPVGPYVENLTVIHQRGRQQAASLCSLLSSTCSLRSVRSTHHSYNPKTGVDI